MYYMGLLTDQGTEVEWSQFLNHDGVGWLVPLKYLFRQQMMRERVGTIIETHQSIPCGG